MSATPRRAVLAGILPGAWLGRGRAQTLHSAEANLRVMAVAESVQQSAAVLHDLPLEAGAALPGLSIRVADLSSITSELQREVADGLTDTEIVLTNFAGYALGAMRDLWQPLPDSMIQVALAAATPVGLQVQAVLGNSGLVIMAAPGGPLLIHHPTRLVTPPRTPAALLDYARQNPQRFQYPRPGQSRFGQLFVNALPHLLGDPDPLDPLAGWPRSWEYLAELGRHVGYYPSSGGAALEEFAEGGSDLMPCVLNSYIGGVTMGSLPADTRGVLMEAGPLLPNSIILAVPRPVPQERLSAIAAYMNFMLAPTIQMRVFGRGLVPSHAAREALPPGAVTPADLQRWTQVMTPELAETMTSRHTVAPLAPRALAAMVRRWDESIGARFGEAP
ncbi:extracellular solute-binding protein [Sediminicoccus sp. KRV36]|uniref:extracellular solute-binding protein n=1 Tax=Sediminicoccus sp. KRV36 TaxID=3133721 RepID=UPI00200E10C4|nr:extracellular solute-binding protein [Sediminicoccus rosea]UPY37010.1 extracellular solute-binding protein [Sediminicoccus rosea]